MPFHGFTCDITGDHAEATACVNCAAQGALAGCQMTAPVVWGIAENLRPDDFGLSVTALIGCPRKFALKRAQPYWLSPAQSWWALRGTLMHQVIAQYSVADFEAATEKRLGMVIDGVEITGQPDLVYPEAGHLIDFKTTARLPAPRRVYYCPNTQALIAEGYQRTKHLDCPHCAEGKHLTKGCERLSDPAPKPHHARQLNVYRLLLAENGVDIRTAEIVYLDMTGQQRMPVNLDDLARTRCWVRERLALFTGWAVPEVLTRPDDLWECSYCPVRGLCEERHGQPVGNPTESVAL